MKRHLPNAGVSVVLAILLSAGMLLVQPGGALGVNQAWVWVMTAWQIGALAAVGRGWNGGWLHGAAVHVGWITYAFATTQYGFIPGSVISIAVQVHSFFRATKPKGSEIEAASVIRSVGVTPLDGHPDRQVWPGRRGCLMGATRTRHVPQDRQHAAHVVIDPGHPMTEAAAVGVDERAELERLRREVAELRIDRELLRRQHPSQRLRARTRAGVRSHRVGRGRPRHRPQARAARGLPVRVARLGQAPRRAGAPGRTGGGVHGDGRGRARGLRRRRPGTPDHRGPVRGR